MDKLLNIRAHFIGSQLLRVVSLESVLVKGFLFVGQSPFAYSNHEQGRAIGRVGAEDEREVRIISAQDLEDMKRFGKMRTYAVAYIESDHKAPTNIDEEGGINPSWNQKLVLQADGELLSQTLAAINVDTYAHGHMRDKLVGTARIHDHYPSCLV
eukprot:Gb_09308 [translate_table: standard]